MKPADLAKDACFVTVGFAVLGFQRVQVLRRDATNRLHGRPGTPVAGVDDLTKLVEAGFVRLDDRITALESTIDTVLDVVQDRLPTPADQLMAQTRTTVRAARRQVRDRVVRAA